jgi:eukaryotic-like serine/threonine-protein kinase
MGEVYRARDTRLQRDVAIKVLPAGVRRRPRSVHARFEREARGARLAESPEHRADLRRRGESDGVSDAPLVMELVEGEDLAAG